MGISCFGESNKRRNKNNKNQNNTTNMSDPPPELYPGDITLQFPIYPQFKPEVDVLEINTNNNFHKKPKNSFEDKKHEIIKQTKEFYDLILDFSKFEQLKEGGWRIIWGKEGKEKYERCRNKDNVVVGVIGNKNKGKSFLLSKFIDKENYSKNEHGFLVTTKGISANFPILDEEGENQTNVITLDSAGKDNPLLDVSNNIDDQNKQTKRNKYEKYCKRPKNK